MRLASIYVHTYIYIYMFSYIHVTRAHNDIILIAAKLASLCVLHDLIPRLFPHVWNEPGNKANECICTLSVYVSLIPLLLGPITLLHILL